MKPYNESSSCVKCGRQDAFTEWHAETYICAMKDHDHVHREVFEHDQCARKEEEYMWRQCRECHYAWKEQPLDHIP